MEVYHVCLYMKHCTKTPGVRCNPIFRRDSLHMNLSTLEWGEANYIPVVILCALQLPTSRDVRAPLCKQNSDKLRILIDALQSIYSTA